MTTPPTPAHAGRRHLLALLATVLACGRAVAQEVPTASRDTLVKAAFLHKFASFVDWPEGTFASPDTPLQIGVLGDALLWRDLQDLARDRSRDGRKVIVRQLQPGDSMRGLHIVYLRPAAGGRGADLLHAAPPGVLTVVDSEGDHAREAVLSFFLDGGRVRFGVSLAAAERQKLRLHPRLVSAARQLQGSERRAGTALA